MLRTIDLFAGCGGMSLGFQNAGHIIQAAFDNWEPAIEVYRANFPDHPIFECDLGDENLNVDQFIQHNPELIIGGPPCQDFSSAGKRDESLGRADLTVAFAQIVRAISPLWFVMENVSRAEGSRAFAKAHQILKESGYGLTQVILEASLCSVPQYRKRLFLIGELQGPDNAVMPYLKRNLAATPMTVRDYLGNRLGIEHYYRHPRSYARRAVFSIDEPSPTVRGVNRPIPATYRRHPGDTAPVALARPLTTRERSFIQTFPEDFIFEGSKADLEQMIGNAVPVRLAQYVADCINEYRVNGPIDEPVEANVNEPIQLGFF